MDEELAVQITITENGPYEVRGSIPINHQSIVPDDRGQSSAWSDDGPVEAGSTYRLCRCGQSRNKPFCDDSHLTNGFDGTETASHDLYLEQAETTRGPRLTLTDAEDFCSSARFCQPGGGIWTLATSGGDDEVAHAVREAGHCPSGRLVVWDASTGVAIEPHFEPSIGLVNDPVKGVAGPLSVRGGIPVVSASGVAYEVRNRVTLCRCGGSSNKPFCDGSHIDIHFQA